MIKINIQRVLLLILAFSSLIIACSNKKEKENQNQRTSSSCGNIDFVLTSADVYLPGENRFTFNYYMIDLAKIRSDAVYLTYPSEDIPSIDSLFSKIHGIEYKIKKDSLLNEKWTTK